MLVKALKRLIIKAICYNVSRLHVQPALYEKLIFVSKEIFIFAQRNDQGFGMLEFQASAKKFKIEIPSL